jgi:hypothetical protein
VTGHDFTQLSPATWSCSCDGEKRRGAKPAYWRHHAEALRVEHPVAEDPFGPGPAPVDDWDVLEAALAFEQAEEARRRRVAAEWEHRMRTTPHYATKVRVAPLGYAPTGGREIEVCGTCNGRWPCEWAVQ